MKLLVCHYEMLTGKRAFDGKSQSSLIASILERQPAPMAEGVSFSRTGRRVVAISPDGTKIAVLAEDGERDIWVWDLVNKTPFKLTSGPARDLCPVWTLDSLSVIFSSNPQGGDEVQVSLSGCARALIRHVRSTAKFALQSNGSED